MDDLIERLKGFAAGAGMSLVEQKGNTKWVPFSEVAGEAAAEIERLRQQNEKSSKLKAVVNAAAQLIWNTRDGRRMNLKPLRRALTDLNDGDLVKRLRGFGADTRPPT